MLLRPYHEQACRLFCTIVRRMHEHEGSTSSAGYQPTLMDQMKLIHHQRAELYEEGMPWIVQVAVQGLKAA
jgi:hypothetical protein